MTEKLKSFVQNDRHFLGLLLILVAIIAFLLGRASVVPPVDPDVADRVVIRPASEPLSPKPPQPEPGVVTDPGVTAQYVASKSGTKYHRTDCPGASRIKPENQVFFATAAAATAAGYTPAANCPGL